MVTGLVNVAKSHLNSPCDNPREDGIGTTCTKATYFTYQEPAYRGIARPSPLRSCIITLCWTAKYRFPKTQSHLVVCTQSAADMELILLNQIMDLIICVSTDSYLGTITDTISTGIQPNNLTRARNMTSFLKCTRENA
jgi:hypothetical protein